MQRETVLALLILGSLGLTGAGVLPPVVGLAVLVLAVLAALARPHSSSTAYGSARMASYREAAQAGLLETQGLILGRADRLDDTRDPQRLLRIRDYVHLATFSPTGGGKGVSLVIPNLLTAPLSIVVTDIKDGENFRATAAWRRQRLGHRVFRFDPFATCGPGGDSFNPLDFIDDRALDFYDQCRDLANMLVVRTGNEMDPHWNDRAENVIAGMIAFTCATASPQDRNLTSVYRLVSSPDRFARALLAMEHLPSHHGVLATAAGNLAWLKDRELGGVLSTVARHLDFLASPAVAEALGSTRFDPRALQDPRQPATLYFCMPTARADSLPGLYRLLVGATLWVITRGAPSEDRRVLFLLDEAAQMGRLQVLERATTLLRGKGIRLWYFFQSHEQVSQCYGDQASVLLDNIGTKQYFHLNSLETAKTLSERIGAATVAVSQRQEGASSSRPQPQAFAPGQAGSTSHSTSVSRSEIARKVLFPDEILTLPRDTMLLFHKNLHVVAGSLVRYYADPEFAEFAACSQAGSPVPPRRAPWKSTRLRRPRVTRRRVAALLFLLSLAFWIALGVAPPLEDKLNRLLSSDSDALFAERIRVKRLARALDREDDRRRREAAEAAQLKQWRERRQALEHALERRQ